MAAKAPARYRMRRQQVAQSAGSLAGKDLDCNEFEVRQFKMLKMEVFTNYDVTVLTAETDVEYLKDLASFIRTGTAEHCLLIRRRFWGR